VLTAFQLVSPPPGLSALFSNSRAQAWLTSDSRRLERAEVLTSKGLKGLSVLTCSIILFRFVDGIMGAWQRYFTHR
jgi:hypothetical protein